MSTLNRPVEMISVCSPEGKLCPARFRIRDDGGELVTVRIRRIRDTEVIPDTGIETFRYICTALISGRERAFELRYSVRDHRWVLWRFMDKSG